MDVLQAGIVPTTVTDLVWYGFGLLATYFLWSIRTELSRLNLRLEKNDDAVSTLRLEFAEHKAQCKERHSHHVSERT